MVLSCPAASVFSVLDAVSPLLLMLRGALSKALHSSPMELKTAGGGQQTKAGQQQETL